MGASDFFNISLVIHIICISIVAGTAIIDSIVFWKFEKEYDNNKQKGSAILQTMSLWVKARGIGFLFLILSGVCMLVLVKGAFASQSWFRVKMLVFLLIILAGLLYGRKYNRRLKRLVTEDMSGQERMDQIISVSSKISAYYLVLVSLFVIIFILSVFRWA